MQRQSQEIRNKRNDQSDKQIRIENSKSEIGKYVKQGSSKFLLLLLYRTEWWYLEDAEDELCIVAGFCCGVYVGARYPYFSPDEELIEKLGTTVAQASEVYADR